jgi:hypothetical protein
MAGKAHGTQTAQWLQLLSPTHHLSSLVSHVPAGELQEGRPVGHIGVPAVMLAKTDIARDQSRSQARRQVSPKKCRHRRNGCMGQPFGIPVEALAVIETPNPGFSAYGSRLI